MAVEAASLTKMIFTFGFGQSGAVSMIRGIGINKIADAEHLRDYQPLSKDSQIFP